MPRLTGPDPVGLPALVSRAEALEAGLSSDQIRHRVRSGRWTTVAHGFYWRGAPADSSDRYQTAVRAHLHLAHAVRRRIPGSVLMLGTAALALGLPLVSGVPNLVELAVPPGSWAGVRSGVRRRHQPLRPGDVSSQLPGVTSPARTWADIARLAGGPDALSAGDAALRAGLVTPAELNDALDRLGRVRGHVRARALVDQLSPLRESPLESLSWYRFHQWSIPPPHMQHLFVDALGPIGRTDFWWPGAAVVGEADGLMKYASWDVVVAEKRREDRLRSLGLRVVRWTWSDLTSRSSPLRRQLEYLLGSGGRATH